MDKKEKIILMLIILLALVFRLVWIDRSPPGLYVDETSIGYNVYSLLQTGRDEYGTSWPIFFQAYGEWKLPAYIYSVFTTMIFTGVNTWAVRLPAVIYGTLSCLFIFFFIKEISATAKIKQKLWPYFASLLLALSPWLYQYTHTGFEVSAAFAFYILGLCLFFKAVNSNKWWLVLSGTAWVLSLYSYNSARIVVPLAVLILFVLYFKKFPLKIWLTALIINLIIAVPFVRFLISPAGWVRAEDASIVFKENYRANLGGILINNYLANISPEYLFIKGDPTIDSGNFNRMGLLHWVEAIFIIIGLFAAVKTRKKELLLLIILATVGFIPPTVGSIGPHALRGLLALPFIAAVSSWGWSEGILIWRKKWLQIGLFMITMLIIVISAVNFWYTYHFKYMKQAFRDWEGDYAMVVPEAQKLAGDYDLVDFGPDLDRISPISVWWYLKIPPEIYQTSPDKNKMGKYQVGWIPGQEAPLKTLAVTREELKGARLVNQILMTDRQTKFYFWSSTAP